MSIKEKVSLKILKFRLNNRFSRYYVNKLTMYNMIEICKGKSENFIDNFWRLFHNAEMKFMRQKSN